METNYFGAVRCTKQVLPAMRKRGSGCIINVTSIAGRVAFFASSAYAASKFALEAFSESLAQEVKGHGIKVALVEPGIIDTPMATTNLPQFDPNTLYPHGRRMHAFFTNPEKPEASPTLVGEMIRYVIESDDPRLRFSRRSRCARLPGLAPGPERRGLGRPRRPGARRGLLRAGVRGYRSRSAGEVATCLRPPIHACRRASSASVCSCPARVIR